MVMGIPIPVPIPMGTRVGTALLGYNVHSAGQAVHDEQGCKHVSNVSCGGGRTDGGVSYGGGQDVRECKLVGDMSGAKMEGVAQQSVGHCSQGEITAARVQKPLQPGFRSHCGQGSEITVARAQKSLRPGFRSAARQGPI